MRKALFLIVFMMSTYYAQSDSLSLYRFDTDTGLRLTNAYIADSVNHHPPASLISHKYSAINLTGQTLLGSAFAVGFSALPLAASVAHAWGSRNHSPFVEISLGIITISSYVIGSACGVYLIAKRENPKISFWETVGYSAIGAGVGAALIAILSTQYETIPGGGGVAAFCPLLGAMFYASFVSSPEPVHNESSIQHMNNYSQKDIYEMSKVFNLNLVRIEF